MKKRMMSTIRPWVVGALVVGWLGCGGEQTVPYEDIEEVPVPSADRPTPTPGPTQPEAETDQGDDLEGTPADDTPAGDTPADDTPVEEPSPSPMVRYPLSEDTSVLYARIWKDPNTFLASLAHDHVLRASGWTGMITYQPGDVPSCSIVFSLPVSELRNDEPAMRTFVGLEGTLSESDRAQVHEHMLSNDQLNEAAFPAIEFVSTSCSGEGGLSGEIEVTGDITIRGVTRQFTVPVDFEVVEDRLYATGEMEFTHSDFDFSPYSALAGAVKNSQRLQILFDVVGDSTQASREAP